MADLTGIAVGVLGKIASVALQEAIAIYGVENEIGELRDMLTAIKAVLLDAEEQQAKNNRLQLWLTQLQDVLYDAEDVLDQLECEALRKQVINRFGGVKAKVRRFFSFSNPLLLRAKLCHKVQEIRKRLSKISTEKDQFGLNAGSAHNGVAQTQLGEESCSFVNKSDVVGRDIDKEKIIKILMQPTGDKNLSVIPIVGIGGLGKTTLAKLVYNDNIVKEQFELRFWLQTRLQDTIKDKKYLLVLDDVWCTDRRRWKELRDLLSVGASESKIIVTTSSLEVTSIMGTHPTHNLEGLSREESMTLFKKCAFDENEKDPRPELLEIGNDIVEKSQGVPLVLITLGSLLCSRDEKYWARIRDSETWEEGKDILPVLKLSYDPLPSHLKRCFSLLSLFSKGDEIQDDDLARLWMALGLVSSTREKQAPEDVVVEYVRELWKRCLIQEVEEHESVLQCKVHDLVHSLATFVAQNDCSVVGLDTAKVPKGVRHVSISSTSLEEISNFNGVPPFLRKKTSERLRAIMFLYELDDGVITREFARTCISKCHHLRYLDLPFGNFEELPRSIGNLKQLRSLDLSQNKRLKKLPDTICKLQNLLFLLLGGCSELVELPKNMERLVSLRFLNVTTKQKSLQESGIQYLENLQFLGLEECKNLEVLFESTCQLTHLRELELENCGRLTSLPFGELTSLERLSMESCPHILTQDKKSNFPSSLRMLSITDCTQVMKLLQCLNESTCSLDSFCIYNCPSFTAIPEWLSKHTRLKELRLTECPKLLSIPQAIQSLTALKSLYIENCGELNKRCEPQTGEDWHKITHMARIEVVEIDEESTDVEESTVD